MSWLLAGIAVCLFLWSFAEAYVWPVVPDAALASTAFLIPDATVTFIAATVLGSVLGGLTAMTAYRRGRRWPLPLVTRPMRVKVAEWLDRGPIGLVNQPLTGVPYKAFVVEASNRRFGVTPWALWTAVFRGARMTTVAAVASAGAGAVERLVPSHITWGPAAVVVSGLAIFAVGWRMVVRRWDGAGIDRTQGDARTMRP